jgi:hypothetical protein
MLKRFAEYYRRNIDLVNNRGHVLVPFFGVHAALAVMGGIGWFIFQSFGATVSPGQAESFLSGLRWIPIVLCAALGGVISLLVTLDTIKGLVAIFVFKDKRYHLF